MEYGYFENLLKSAFKKKALLLISTSFGTFEQEELSRVYRINLIHLENSFIHVYRALIAAYIDLKENNCLTKANKLST